MHAINNSQRKVALCVAPLSTVDIVEQVTCRTGRILGMLGLPGYRLTDIVSSLFQAVQHKMIHCMLRIMLYKSMEWFSYWQHARRQPWRRPPLQKFHVPTFGFIRLLMKITLRLEELHCVLTCLWWNLQCIHAGWIELVTYKHSTSTSSASLSEGSPDLGRDRYTKTIHS